MTSRLKLKIILSISVIIIGFSEKSYSKEVKENTPDQTQNDSVFTPHRDTVKNASSKIGSTKKTSFPWDGNKMLAFSVDLMQALVDEYALTVDYKPLRILSFMGSLGYVNPYGILYKPFHGLSPSQGDHPFLAYEGVSGRLGTYFDMQLNKNANFYIGPQFLYRYVKYDHQSFEDQDRKDHYVDFTRSETANIYGLSAVMGVRIMSDSKQGICFYTDIFWGYEYRYKTREYSTFTVTGNGRVDKYPIGHFSETQHYSMPVFGVRIGFGTNKKLWDQVRNQ